MKKHYNYLGEINHDPSMTVPDEALTPQQILQKFVKGQSVPSFKPEYSEDDFPDWNQLDLVEQQEYIEENKKRIKELEDDLKENQRKAYEDQQNKRTKNDEQNDE